MLKSIRVLLIFLSSAFGLLTNFGPPQFRGRQSTTFQATPGVLDQSLEPVLGGFRYKVSVPFISGISDTEWSVYLQLLDAVAAELDVSLERSIVAELREPTISSKYHGTTGRVMLFHHLNDNNSVEDAEFQETFLGMLAELQDDFLYSGGGELTNPVLFDFCFPSEIEGDLVSSARSRVEECIEGFQLVEPMSFQPYDESQMDTFSFLPSKVIGVDGAFVRGTMNGDQSWDTSEVAVFDNLVSNNLRERLLDLIGGSEEGTDPDSNQWTRGALLDLPQDTKDEITSSTKSTECLGMTPSAIANLCEEKAHSAIEEMQDILTSIFPDYHVSRLPEAVLGEAVSPLTANAPMFGDSFQPHIDGDPFFAPPSPWTDVFGRYPNRSKGKPRFVSMLVYLNKEWKDDWGASTLFYDVATNTESAVDARPGRCVMMDQDITHSVSAPSVEGVGPRYSLVFKLVLHPKTKHQDMKALNCGREWPQTLFLGSAKDQGKTEEKATIG